MIKYFNQNCMEGLKLLEDNSVDLILTSPPYNVGKEYEKHYKNQEEYIDEMDDILYLCKKKLKDTGSICYQVGSPNNYMFYELMEDMNLIFHNDIIWAYNWGQHAKYRLSQRHQHVLWFSKTNDYKFNLDDIRVPQKYPNKKAYKGKNKGKLSGNPLGKNPGDFWTISQIKYGHSENTKHPAQYPEELCDRIIKMCTDKGDLVVDPFCGSGTTLASAKRLERDCIGFEVMKEYCDIIEKRLQ